ncbi:LemA family protein, partial [Lysobacter sp. D1-1-M9]|uniref:LemA family protein n=1 Tax=Novilysobacter longmucuonensis TaxID=3098603 RepID=UPI002FC99FEA
NANFAQLQRDLVEVEEHLQYARRFYNGAVRDLNDTVQRVPDLLVARTLGFGEAEFFQADPGHRAAPVVEMQS